MRFRFCGDGDCPDWVLAGIHSTLSELPAVKLKFLTQMMVKSVLGEHIPDEKLQDIFSTNKNKNNFTPVKLSFSCLRFLILNAVRHNADENTFTIELQQLGLQKDHSIAICKVMTEHLEALKTFLKDTSLTINELDGMSYKIPKDTVDCAQLSIDIANEIVDGIPMKTTHQINISKSDIPILINELKIIRNMMEDLDYEKRHDSSGNESNALVNADK